MLLPEDEEEDEGARIWVPHENNVDEVWEGATLAENYQKGDKELKIKRDTGQEKTIKIKTQNDLPPLRNPTILVGQKDLTALSYLHEPAVLHNLKVRFRERQSIYTYCGIILVAINPYAELPLYGPDIIRAYRGHSMGELEPHIFAVAEEAYTKLEREKCDLSIIVSGESGAGKTVSAKYAMRYFAAVGGSESETQVERKVLASSPIMEAFGNAKTTRNDNSSRFGKFTKLLFKNNMGVMNLTGATMQTYLLEKSRVVYQSLGERNYHIFYQICAAREEHPELILDHQDKFKFLNLGKSPHIDRVSDISQFKDTITAMNVLGFGSAQIAEILKILAGILHLGNIHFTNKYKAETNEIDPDACDIMPNDLHLHVTGEMLKIRSDDLRKWLITRQIESVNENVLIPNSIAAAESAKDALAKHIYAKLFQYIVGVMNKSLNTGRKQSCFIGVLDIYGFETFDTNSFEQFCINYANEKLQQQFNQHVFKLEQEEYLKEGIEWTMIDFIDNQPCIDLIESKLGILDLLDEECRMPKGSDESWAGKLVEKCAKFPHFEKPRFGTTSFFVKHFSATVQYDVFGFLEKNRDTVSKELVNVVAESQMGLCKKLMQLEEVDALNDGKHSLLGGRVIVSASKSQLPMDQRKRITPSKQHKRTVGSQFRDSLALLISTLHATTPHYVRCIKPNEEKMAFKWDAAKILQQLRACGVLETVRISAAGFPSRWVYHDFYSRYQLLCHRKYLSKSDIKNSCRNIVAKWINDEEKFRFGNTQIFFRAGQVAYLEQIRTNIRKKYIIIVQSVIRRFVYRKRYLRLRMVAIGIQTYSRGYIARQKARAIREARAALIISKYAKGYLCRRQFIKLRLSVNGIQQYARGMLARIRFKNALNNYKATQVQRFCRGYLARLAYKKKLHNIIVCQSAVRRFLARKLFKRMKAEAKTISHIQKMYKGLENKIISLQQRIDELNKDNTQLKLKTTAIPVLKNQLELKKGLEIELKQLKYIVDDKENNILTLQKQLEIERDEKMQLLEEKDHEAEEWNKQKQTWRIENEELRKQVDEMIELAKKKEKTTQYRSRILSEVDNNEIHEAYQRALKDKDFLEGENFMLKEELSRLQKVSNNTGEYTNHSRTMSNASSQNEEDFGYSSAKNTLEMKRSAKGLSAENANQASPESFAKIEVTSTPKSEQTSLILKLRSVLEEEKKRSKRLAGQIEKLLNKNQMTEDSLRVSELEVENEKLRHDYSLLRNSIQRGVEMQEIEAQQNALQEELRRRRDECIQLKAVLQQQSQSLKSFGGTSMSSRDGIQESTELMEAFQAQKLVNRQLESELTALTEENNAHLEELSKHVDELRSEKARLESILQKGIEDGSESNIEILRRNDKYLRYELEKSYLEYTQLQEEMNALTQEYEEAKRKISKLTLRLNEHGISTVSPKPDTSKCVASVVKKRSQHYQGILKYNPEDVDKIFQRLIAGLVPRVAVGLLPGLPAFLLFMCIRYTDLVNSEVNVKVLLTKYVIQMKKIHKNPITSEMRVLWLVNSLTLHNLLKQYGGIDEYINLNTPLQNQQQLKNFDLSEYRRVIYEIIVSLYHSLMHQLQVSIKPYVVPAVLDHDEIQRGQSHGNRRALSLDSSPEHSKIPAPKQLVNQLEHYYKQFHFFGLHLNYIEQIFHQLLYYICAISMNTLMLRGDMCMWGTGMKIRYNVTCLEDWVREKKMSTDVTKPLAPLIDVSQLLQSRKTEQDVDSVYELCNSLTTAQVMKMIKSYNSDDCESSISSTFVEKLTEKLNQRKKERNNEFTMDQEFIHPFKVVYNYSEVKLEDIEIPKELHLDDLLTRI